MKGSFRIIVAILFATLILIHNAQIASAVPKNITVSSADLTHHRIELKLVADGKIRKYRIACFKRKTPGFAKRTGGSTQFTSFSSITRDLSDATSVSELKELKLYQELNRLGKLACKKSSEPTVTPTPKNTPSAPTPRTTQTVFPTATARNTITNVPTLTPRTTQTVSPTATVRSTVTNLPTSTPRTTATIVASATPRITETNTATLTPRSTSTAVPPTVTPRTTFTATPNSTSTVVPKDFNVTAYTGFEVIIPLQANGADPKSLQFNIDSQPTSGKLSHVTNNEYRYESNTGFLGNDSFKYSIKQSNATSKTVSISVLPVSKAQSYPIAFLSYPRAGDGQGLFKLAGVDENGSLYRIHTGTDLMLFKPDGSEEVLVKGHQPDQGFLGIYDFTVSLDGKSILYSHVRTFSDLAEKYADIFRIDLATKKITQLTNSRSEYVPPRGALKYTDSAPKNQQDVQQAPNQQRAWGTVWNVSPAEVGDGSIVFTSNRDGYAPPAAGTLVPAMLLYRMDADGKNVLKIGALSLGGAAHPTVSKTGRIYFSSGEQQAHRSNGGNNWVIWSINPDGTDWQPEISAIGSGDKIINDPFHYQTESSDGTLVVQRYYDARFHGILLGIPKHIPTQNAPTKFGSMFTQQNAPWVEKARFDNVYLSRPFQPRGIYNLTPWISTFDIELRDSVFPNNDGPYRGIVSQPAAIPLNGTLLVWTGDKGEANSNLGIYRIPDVSIPTTSNADLKNNLVLDLPTRHEFYPRPVVPFSSIYGIEKPPVPTGKKASRLPKGSPFGVIGTSTLNYRELVKNALPNMGPNDVETFADQDMEYLRVIAFNPTLSLPIGGYWAFNRDPNPSKPIAWVVGIEGYYSAFNERTGFFEKLIPLKKYKKADGSVHYGPNPPAGSQPILDPEGKPDTSFQAEIPADQVWTFQILNAKQEAISTAMTWHQVMPGEQRTDCQGCHAHNKPSPFNFEDSFAAKPEYKTERLENIKIVEYLRDISPIVSKYNLNWDDQIWRSKSKDGTVPQVYGYASHVTNIDDDPRFSDSEAKTIRSWIDTGLMSSMHFMARTSHIGCNNYVRIEPKHNTGPYADTTKPTLNVKVDQNQILIGAFDAQSKINLTSLTVKASVPLAGRPAGTELADLFSFNSAEWIWTLNTSLPTGGGTIAVSIKDNQTAYDYNNRIWSDVGNETTRIIDFK